MTRALRVLTARAVPLALLVLALFAPSRACAAEPRLLASDASGAILEVDVPEPVLSTLESASGRYQRLSFEGFDSDAGIGFPLLPVQAFLLAVPEGARVVATATGEGERVYDGRIFKLTEHTLRLANSATKLGFALPYDIAAIEQACRQVVAANGIGDGYVRPLAWRGPEMMGVSAQNCRINVAIAAWTWPAYFTPEARLKGIRMTRAIYDRPAPNTFSSS